MRAQGPICWGAIAIDGPRAVNWSVLGRSKGELRTMRLHYPSAMALARPCITANLGRTMTTMTMAPAGPWLLAKRPGPSCPARQEHAPVAFQDEPG